jgi:hypothetical protein
MADDSLLPLSGDEKLALVAGLKRLIDEDRYPLSPRVRTLGAAAAAEAGAGTAATAQALRAAEQG